MKILLSTICSPSARVNNFGRYGISAALQCRRAVRSTRYFASIANARAATAFLLAAAAVSAQEQPKDSTQIKLDEVLVSAVRATDKTPVSFSNLKKEDFEKRNLGQDIPTLMNFLPSVVTTSDAGNGIGYTGIRVRGSDATRVNITINGIPYNDSESHGTFWVNMPDFASSVSSLQLQRGVGTSTNGSGAFGASLNLLTDNYAGKASGEIANSFGSFNSRKHTVKFSTGLLNEHFELAGRLSNIHSDGFIDRAESELKSYFLQGTYIGKTTLIKALVFGGTEKTCQSWNGLEDPEKLEHDRRYNTSGYMFTDAFGNEHFYGNETDNYQQDHYQLHWNEKISEGFSTNLALHYTKGKGYYENFESEAAFEDFGLEPVAGVDGTDLIRQKWLDNDFYGFTGSANYKKGRFEVILGGGWNKYEGAHFGKVIWARYFSSGYLGDKYYDDDAVKTDGNVFAKATINIVKGLSAYADLQYRTVGYEANGAETGLVDDSFSFFNPKAGLTYSVSPKHSVYVSYARANREPNRDDYENGSPEPEQLDDFELGWRFSTDAVKVNINGYYMKYKNQLVLTGALNDVGAPERENVGDSYRMGIEAEAVVRVTPKIFLKPNVTLSRNRNQDFYFQRDGVLQNLGDTDIAFSPDVVAANQIVFLPVKGLQLALLSKFVGDQYMGNIDSKVSKLRSYAVSDLSISYEIPMKKIFKSITIDGMVNNIFDYEYESNGYFYTYDDDFSNPPAITTVEGVGFYPQAGINFLAGLTLKF